MAQAKRVTLHPLNPDGSIDTSVNLYPKTLLNGIVNLNGDQVDVATQQELDSQVERLDFNKQEKLVSGRNIKTINDQNILDSGNLRIEEITTSEREQIVANTNARHTHANKELLDNITNEDIENWDSKVSANDSTIRIFVDNVEVDSFTLNQAYDESINISSVTKIDSISIDDELLPIVNKNVDIPTVRTDRYNQDLSAEQKVNAKTNLDLQNVDNTRDLNKPISHATQSALDSLADHIASEASRAETAEGQLAGDITQEVQDRIADVNGEETRAKAAEAALATSISNEETRATQAETVITNSLADEASRATTAESSLNTKIENETSRATQAESGLSVSISNEALARSSADSTLQTNIESEATARSSADTQLQTNITAEETRAKAAESSLSTSISNEASARSSADNVLQGNIDSEASTRSTADTVLQGNIDAEATARSTADTTLQGNINTVNDKLDVNVHVEGSSDEITYNGDTVTKSSPYKNLKSGITGSRSETIHLANATTAGLMAYEDYNQIRSNTSRIEALEGQTKRLIYTDSSTPSAQDISDFVDAYLEEHGITPSPEEYVSIAVVVSATYHIWHYYNDDGWRDDGTDTVTQFTNSSPGVILGAGEVDGSIYAESNGTGSVYGWSALKNRVSNNETDIASLGTNKANKVANATNGHIAGLTSNGDLTDSGIDPSNIPLKDAANTFSKLNTFNKGISVSNSNGSTFIDGNQIQLNGATASIKHGTSTIYTNTLPNKNGTVLVDSDISDMVICGGSLGANEIVLGSNGLNVITSGYKVGASLTTWDDTSDIYLPTMKSISSYVSGKDANVVHKGTSTSSVAETIYGRKTFNDPLLINNITLENTDNSYGLTITRTGFSGLTLDSTSFGKFKLGLDATSAYLNTVAQSSGGRDSFIRLPAVGTSASPKTMAVTDDITSAINALSITDITNTAGKTVKKITESGGKVNVEFQDISITESQISNFGSYVPTSRTIASLALSSNITKSSLLTALNVADGAQVNVIEGITLNNATVSPVNKVVNLQNIARTGYNYFTDTQEINGDGNGNTFGYNNSTLSQLEFWNTDFYEDDEYHAQLGLYHGSYHNSFRINYRDETDPTEIMDYTLDIGTHGLTFDIGTHDFDEIDNLFTVSYSGAEFNVPVVTSYAFKRTTSNAYGVVLPVSSSWAANRTIATTADFSVVNETNTKSVTANGSTLTFGSNAFNSTTIPTISANPSSTTATLNAISINGTNYALAAGTQVIDIRP